ncbi:MAG: META domain-containing protein [Ignavibacteriaceae bacterium]|nr:META domain-containing protein [Ignavibacteriaceae bacterium]
MSILITACSSSNEENKAVIESPLYEHVWELYQLEKANLEGLDHKRIPYLAFQGGRFNFGGFAGCNTVTGKFEISDKSFTFGELTITKMNCDDMNVEITFLNALNKVNSYKVADKVLTFYHDDLAIMIFKPQTQKE